MQSELAVSGGHKARPIIVATVHSDMEGDFASLYLHTVTPDGLRQLADEYESRINQWAQIQIILNPIV
jgi:hypothetical protein